MIMDDSDTEENKTLFDRVFLRTIGKTEGSVEKKLREAGEWVLDRTEGASRSSGILFPYVFILILLPPLAFLMIQYSTLF